MTPFSRDPSAPSPTSGQSLSDNAIVSGEDLFRSIYEHSAMGMAVCDPAGRFINVNAAMCRFLGYSKQELLQRTFMDVTHPDDVSLNVERRSALLKNRGGGAFQIEKRYVHKSGKVLWALTVVSVVRDRNGTPLYTIGQMLDISAQKHNEQELRLSRESLAYAQRLAHVGDWNWNIVSNTISWSDEIYRIFGIDKDRYAISYDLFLSRIHRDDRAAVVAAVNRAIAERRIYEIDHRICMNDGSIKVVHEIGSVYYDADGKPQHMVGTVQDITERHAHEQTVLEYRNQIQKLAAHDNLLIESERKRIAQEVHDEIGQLLTVLKMDMQLCGASVGADSPIREHTDEMLKLIDRTIASVRSITHHLRPPALNLGLVPALEWLAQDVMRRTTLQIKLHYRSTHHAIDDHVATAIFRVAQESITNIIRHANASTVNITLDQQASRLSIEISDNGGGFDAAVGYRSGGFGLIGMRERIANIGGTFAIESGQEIGTALRITLPVTA